MQSHFHMANNHCLQIELRVADRQAATLKHSFQYFFLSNHTKQIVLYIPKNTAERSGHIFFRLTITVYMWQGLARRGKARIYGREARPGVRLCAVGSRREARGDT